MKSLFVFTSMMFAAFSGLLLQGQSSADTAQLALEVHSAEYNSAANSVAVELVNNGQMAVTAYGLDITLTANGKVLSHVNYSSDLLDQVLSGRIQTRSSDSWAGAIQPADVYSESLPANIKDTASITAPVVAQVVVKGIIWSDGTVEGPDHFMMQQILDRRTATLNAETQVLSILNAQSGEANTPRRLEAALKNLSSLPQQSAESLNTDVLNDAATTLAQIKSSTSPDAQLKVFSSKFANRHQIRAALMQAAAQ
jgi:hypothetical protein